MTADKVLGLIDSVYAAAEDARLWPGFLESLSEALDSKMTVLMYQDVSRAQGGVSAAVRIDPACVQAYADYYSARNIFFTTSNPLLPGDILHDTDVEATTLLNSEYFNDFLAPFGARYCAGVIVRNDHNTVALVSTMRAPGKSPFGQDDIRLLSALQPHLVRALQLHRRLTEAETCAAVSLDVLNRFRCGVILVNERGEVAAANHAAEVILRANDGLAIAHKRLRASSDCAQRALAGLLTRATNNRDLGGHLRSGFVAVPRTAGRPYTVFAAPLKKRDDNAFATAVVFITDCNADAGQPEPALRLFFDLSPAEAKVASRLMAGHDTAALADELSVSTHTIRSHIKSIFQKTGTSRQAELVSLLNSAIVPVDCNQM